MALAPSRILPTTCTTRYGESPSDDEVAVAWRAFAEGAPARLPWFPIAHKDMPTGTVWSLVVCPPVERSQGRNLPQGEEPSAGVRPRPDIVLPEVLWACRVLARGFGPRRICSGPSGAWISEWNEQNLERIDGPFSPGSATLERWRSIDGPVDTLAWIAPREADLVELADECPEAQMLSERTASLRSESRANRTLLFRLLAIALVGGLGALLVRAPVWLFANSLANRQARLVSVRPELDRLDRIRVRSLEDAVFLDSSAGALRPSASARPLLGGLARRLPPGVRLQSIQLESPPSDTGWSLRMDARLADWRGVATLVDSLNLLDGVAEVRVDNQQRDGEKVRLVLLLRGNWP